ncbi:MAG: glycoside hydrolase family 3 N-terminal domain-containing protein [Aminipila sp.]
MNAMWKKTLSLLVLMSMILTSFGSLAEAIQPQELGSGDVLWTETEMADGWTKIENQGGATLGYSKESGLPIIQVDGYAFKDLNKNGTLEVFEDWRADYETRAQNLVDTQNLSAEWKMGLKMNPFRVGAASPDTLEDITKTALDMGYRHIRFPGGEVRSIVGWNNTIQKYLESQDTVVIPTTYIADPLGGGVVSKWPGYLGVAASFDPELAAQYGKVLSEEWRALGISMKVAPQIDLATEPRWKRADMTFGEDPQLSVDMTRAMVNTWQSTYDADGNDLGWGKDSVNTQIKHLMGEGAAEGGRESHSLDGAYNVYPGGQFYTHMLPFLAALDLPGKTERSSSAMTNFSIAVDENGDSIGGERYSTSYNVWKLQDLWRGLNNWTGYILTDFSIIGENGPGTGKPFGVEHLTIAERMLLLMEAGNDGFGGLGGDPAKHVGQAMEAYALGVEKHGQEGMDKILNDSTVRALKTLFNVGVVDNPYLTIEDASTVANSAQAKQAGFDAQVKSVVMLKNSGSIIAAAGERKTVYVPWKFNAAVQGRGGVTPASVGPAFNLSEVLKYFDVVTDKAGDPTGEKDAEGKPTFTPNDIVRATPEEIATADFALLRIKSPQNGNPTVMYTEQYTVPEDYEYLPISLQYRPYTADSFYVRMESIGGQITTKEVQGTYGIETVTEKENRSYYGKTGIINNESDLDLVLYASSVVDKVVVAVDVKSTMVFSEFESEVDGIVISFSGDRAPAIDDAALLEVIAGNVEPSGLLPMQMPLSMETVEAQFEDVPRDMEVYVDADGNAYDFTFGLNWSGVINDERVAKYNVEPIVGEDPFLK